MASVVQRPEQPFTSRLLYLPFALLQTLASFLRPFAPQLVPIAVCLLFIPVVILFSATAGYVVWKETAVGWQLPVYLQYGDGRPPYYEVELPKLVPQQPYDISLVLRVPAAPSNFDLGNFMTSLTLSTTSNKTIAYIRKPTQTIIIQPGKRIPLVSRLPSVLTITVPLFEALTPGVSRVNAVVELGRRDGWKSLGDGQGRELSVLSASLKGTLYNSGIRGLATRFPLVSGTIASITFLIISLLILGACLVPTMLTEMPEKAETAGPLPAVEAEDEKSKVRADKGKRVIRAEAPVDEDDQEEEKLIRRRRSRTNTESTSRSRQEPDTVKMEEDADQDPPLRRRRSRITQAEAD